MLTVLLIGILAPQSHFCLGSNNKIILSELVPVSISQLELGMMDEYLEHAPVQNDTLEDSPNRIVGGNETTIELYPHQVSFIVNNTFFCGGFIVSENYIVTAAHCAQKVDPDTVVLRAGSTWRREGTIIPIAKVIPHPQYNMPKFDKDVAVLKTAQPIVFTDTIKPIPLPPLGRLMKGGSEITVSGWGRTQPGSSTIPERLMYVKLPVVKYFECLLVYFNVLTVNEFCAGHFFLGKVGTCQGDSGGAASQDGMAVGIVSYGRGCGNSLSPSVFADIASPTIRKFITEHTGL